jgi:hypothetical protein
MRPDIIGLEYRTLIFMASVPGIFQPSKDRWEPLASTILLSNIFGATALRAAFL